ncbi:MAG TPA: type IV toxin-antitoxin system AbiEi family antitoxin domain-containing protein [Thermoleophilaceae bacterium]|jgi:very-short-patch-repair endonuclease
MDSSDLQPSSGEAWRLAASQHGLVARRQLIELGFHPKAIAHRVARGRLHRVRRGVYSVGPPRGTRHEGWMAAVLACGAGAVLSHLSAAALRGVRRSSGGPIEVSVRPRTGPRPQGVAVHRRRLREPDVTVHRGVPVTTLVRTLMDLSPRLRPTDVEGAVNQADILGLARPADLRAAIEAHAGQPGAAVLRRILDRRTFAFTRSGLERHFLRIVRDAGLPRPLTCTYVNGVEADFHWPQLGLVVEADSLTYHRTPQQQAKDRIRDQVHVAAGMTPLRFTHGQIRYEPRYVRSMLTVVVRRLVAQRARA